MWHEERGKVCALKPKERKKKVLVKSKTAYYDVATRQRKEISTFARLEMNVQDQRILLSLPSQHFIHIISFGRLRLV